MYHLVLRLHIVERHLMHIFVLILKIKILVLRLLVVEQDFMRN
jgi:hypothetical protein